MLVRREVAGLIAACDAIDGTVIVVTSEVGLGLVPMNALGRVYRDTLGRANQALAARAEAVYTLLAGIPIDIKKLAVDQGNFPNTVSSIPVTNTSKEKVL